jgi:hypothetical protein
VESLVILPFRGRNRGLSLMTSLYDDGGASYKKEKEVKKLEK